MSEEKAKSKVYFTDFRTHLDVPLTAKLQKLMRMAGIGQIDMNGKFVAIKMHFGELGNLAYLRPNYAKAVALAVMSSLQMVFGERMTLRSRFTTASTARQRSSVMPLWMRIYSSR